MSKEEKLSKDAISQLQLAVALREKNLTDMREAASDTLRQAVNHFTEVRELVEREQKNIDALRQMINSLK